MTEKKNKVFLSYTQSDQSKADYIKNILSENGLSVFDNDFKNEMTWEDEIQYVMHNSDYLFILLSPQLFKRNGLEFAFSDHFFSTAKKRNIYVFPLLIEPCDIPEQFLEYELFDLTETLFRNEVIDDIVQRMKVINRISFDSFSPIKFEELIYDLLLKLNFKNLQKQVTNFDSGMDFIAEFYSENPFKVKEREIWSIESKFYRESRFNIGTLHKIVERYKYISRNDSKLLLITNSILNSIAEQFLHDIKNTSLLDITVIDGFQLKNIIAKEQSLVEKYFAS